MPGENQGKLDADKGVIQLLGSIDVTLKNILDVQIEAYNELAEIRLLTTPPTRPQFFSAEALSTTRFNQMAVLPSDIVVWSMTNTSSEDILWAYEKNPQGSRRNQLSAFSTVNQATRPIHLYISRTSGLALANPLIIVETWSYSDIARLDRKQFSTLGKIGRQQRS